MSETTVNGQDQQSADADRARPMTIERAVAAMQAKRETAQAATSPEAPAPDDGGPKASEPQPADAGKDSSDGEVAQEEPQEQQLETPDQETPDAKDPELATVYRLGPDGEEQDVTLGELIDSYERRADTTRKTQALAEHRKQLEAKAQEYQTHLAGLQETADRLKQRGEQYDAILRQFEGSFDEQGRQFDAVDWAKLRAEDPVEFNARWAERQMWQERKANIAAERQRLAQEQVELQKGNEAKAIVALQQHVQQKYPQWKDDKLFKRDSEAMDRTALKLGFTPDEVRKTTDPRVWDLLWLAAQGELRADAVTRATTPATGPKAAAPEPYRIIKPGSARPSARTARATEASQLMATARRTGSLEDAYRAMQFRQANASR